MGTKMHAGANSFLFRRARQLRSDATHAEAILWGYLKTKPSGFKFRRQHPYSAYILDFYCHSLKLVIEVDGSIHESEDVKKNDLLRQKCLESDGLTVLRFTNDQVARNAEEIFKHICDLIVTRKDEQKKQ